MDEITYSISRLISSLISRLNSSLILASWSCVAGVADEEDQEADPKNCLTPAPNPAVRTRPGCSGMPIASVVYLVFLDSQNFSVSSVAPGHPTENNRIKVIN